MSSSRVSGPVLRRLQLLQTKPNRPLDAIASKSHSSSGRFIPLPPLFIAIAHCHPLFPNLDFCSIYQISSSSSPSHNSILSYSVFSYVLNLSHFQLTFFFFFFFLRRPLLLFLSQGVQCNSKYLYSLLLAQERQFLGSFFLVWHLLKLRTSTFFGYDDCIIYVG